MKIKTVLLILMLVFTMSCKEKKDSSKKEEVEVNEPRIPEHKKEKKHWTYGGETGPNYWKEIEKDSDCGGRRQSPINIIAVDAVSDVSLKPIDTHYSSNIKFTTLLITVIQFNIILKKVIILH